jgi:hypothetical protein
MGVQSMKLVAMFGIKYEPQWMVDGLIENLKGWVDDFAIFDCRGRDKLWIHEGYYRSVLREKAYQMGADWVLTTSPDERWEKNAGKVIRPLINDNKDKVIYENLLRELYDTKHYRIDGIWGRKYRRRLYPLYYREQSFANKPIQCPSPPQDDGYEVKRIDVNIYHLKMIEPENRKLRAKVFK